MTVITRIGIDYAGVSCVKITKGDRDPMTIPDSERGAFYYNSKWAADVRLMYSGIVPPLTGPAYSYIYEPSGSGRETYKKCILFEANNAQQHYFRKSYFPDLVYDYPLHEVKPIRKTNGRFVQNGMMIHGSGYEDRGTRRYTAYPVYSGWMKNVSLSPQPGVGLSDISIRVSPTVYSGTETFNAALAVWNLPGDETPIRDGVPQAPIPGQHSIIINRDAVKVAKPGFDARVASATQLALDSSNRPAKIIAADDIALAAGVTEYNLGFAVPPTTLVDVHYYVGSDIYYPASPTDLNFGGEHWIDGGKLYFNNQSACRARFIVYAFDNTPPTAGNNDVFRRTVIDGQPVMQLLRPGASANPSFADIVLDSRWPCLQILKEGYIPVGNGLQQHAITYEGGADVFPMVKYMTICSDSLGNKLVKQPRVAIGRLTHEGSVHIPLFQCGDSTYCRLTNSQATFYTARGAPYRAYWDDYPDYSNKRVSFEYDSTPISGIRYYIFGLPKKD